MTPNLISDIHPTSDETLPHRTTRIGELLVDKGLLTAAQQQEGQRLAKLWNVRFRDAVVSMGWVRTENLHAAIAEKFGLPFVNLIEEPPVTTLLTRDDIELYSKHLVMPWRRTADGQIAVAVADPCPETELLVHEKWGAKASLVVTSKFDIIWTTQRLFDDHLSDDAVYALARRDPVMSAQQVITAPQLIVLWGLVTLLAAGFAWAPVATAIIMNLVITLWYLGNFIFRGLLAWVGGHLPPDESDRLEATALALRDEDLPVFTVLVPMYKEPEVLPILAHALRNLNYPRAKLDIKLVLEADDKATIDAAKALSLEGIFEIIRVPPSQPKTKPKACNYALRFARGDYLVIYDAEDKPEPNQLRKVVAAFREAPANTVCIQCRLNFYNTHENWLTRMFTLDYSLLFDLLLPGLERLKVPIPLGGTSNHFRLDVLRELHGWDPFNVTEDADLGIRLTQKGYRVGVIESTTLEEANVDIGNWIRQRSRWIKGYMMTLLVHTRRPLHLVRSVGPLGALGFVFFIGGTVLSSLVNPIYWGLLTASVLLHASRFDELFPPFLGYLSLFNLLIGNSTMIYLTMVAPLRRKWLDLVPFAPSVIAYWTLASVAAYKALWQLVFKPFYWEKTRHGISAHTAIELAMTRGAAEDAS